MNNLNAGSSSRISALEEFTAEEQLAIKNQTDSPVLYPSYRLHRHFYFGDHAFRGLNVPSLKPIWGDYNSEDLFLDSEEAELGLKHDPDERLFHCEVCGLAPWQVTNLPLDFFDFSYVSYAEGKLLESATSESNFTSLLMHLAFAAHDWPVYDAVCRECGLEQSQLSNCFELFQAPEFLQELKPARVWYPRFAEYDPQDSGDSSNYGYNWSRL